MAFTFIMMLIASPADAQQLRVAYDTPEFTEYALQNDSLKISAPFFLEVPYVNGQRRYRIIEQSFERRSINDVQSSRQVSTLSTEVSASGSRQLQEILKTTEAPFVQAGAPQEHRKQLRSTLIINATRIDEQQESYLIARDFRIRVYKEESWSPSARAKATEMAGKADTDAPHPLSSGQWYKIPVLRSGMYRLSPSYLSDLGIDTDAIDPQRIQLWGTPGSELPRANSAERPAFSELPIMVEGEDDGSFDGDDAVIFYAKDVNERIFDPSDRSWSHKLHAYADSNFVFLRIGEENGRRLSPHQNSGQVTEEIDRFRDFLWKEEDLYMPEARHRSGTLWFGQLFTPEFNQQVIFSDTLPGFIEGSSIEFEARLAGRSRSVGNFSFEFNNENFGSANVSPITNLNSSTGRAATLSSVFRQINGVSLAGENDQFEISATYSIATAESRGWLDYINIRAERRLVPKNGILNFFSPDDAPLNTSELARYSFSGFNSEPLVMDVTNPAEPVLIEAEGSGNNWSAVYRYDAGRQLIAATRFYTPAQGTALGNQHISGNRSYPNYIIITDETLLEQAEEMAAYRSSKNGYRTAIVTQRQIFNEFSGGVADPVAIRDYLKHLYDIAGLNEELLPEYLLLMGNTTFDYKGIEEDAPMRNLVFNFQHYVDSDNLSRTRTYGSDDYFGFLDDNEGEWRSFNQQNRLDLKIGRLPVQTPAQAALMIEKIKTFEDREQRGDWRTLFTFTADDNVNSSSNDRDLHTFNADFTAESINENESGIRLSKLYQFSFPVENTPAGQRVPQATDALVRQINDGTLVVNFSGHGSEQQLTQQRLFQSSDIPRLTNRNRPMIMITATCSFGRFDDNTDFSGAEKLMLHDNGGSVASMTTSRVVFTNSNPDSDSDNNFVLNIELTRNMSQRNPDGSSRTIGQVFKDTKNVIMDAIDTGNSTRVNQRKFVLLGDPAMNLGLPEQEMQITSINNLDNLDENPLQLRSLDRVQVEGQVVKSNGQPDLNFSGEGNVRVFDASRYEELPNPDVTCRYLDNCSFRVQNDVLFNGRVSITNGQFSTEFIVPRDIAYSDSLARIHVYGNGLGEEGYDAVGSFSNFFLNGRNEDAENTFDGPEMDVYLNDDGFVNGSLTNPDPILYADIFSEAGVNTTGAGVGHEITATLTNEDNPGNEQTFILNNFYESELDDFTRGQIEFPLDNLEDGRYALLVRAWDVFNNVGEAEVFFEVAGGDALSIRNVYNYPNPMHNVTRFAFEHNQPVGQPLDVFIRVYTLSGRPVAQIRESVVASGNLEMFEWHGRDDDNNRLAAGTYLYHLRVRTDGLEGRQSREKIERLVIIR
jgi:hypothetical protein